jgi:hypothetical protein
MQLTEHAVCCLLAFGLQFTERRRYAMYFNLRCVELQKTFSTKFSHTLQRGALCYCSQENTQQIHEKNV